MVQRRGASGGRAAALRFKYLFTISSRSRVRSHSNGKSCLISIVSSLEMEN